MVYNVGLYACHIMVLYGWLQVQRGEESQINIMGNVNQPFLATGRYDVFFISTPPTFKLQLHVTGRQQKLSTPAYYFAVHSRLDSLRYLCFFKLGHLLAQILSALVPM